MSKSFSVAVEKQQVDEVEPYEFTFEDDPDHTLQVYEPSQGEMLVIMSFTDIEDGDTESAQLAQKTLLGLFPTASRNHIRRRLADRHDPLDLEDLMGVFEKVVEAAGGRPTESLPASTPSRATNGKSSTARARRAASTRSTSGSTDSATSSTTGRSKASKTARSSTTS